jgi:hypothetical protein
MTLVRVIVGVRVWPCRGHLNRAAEASFLGRSCPLTVAVSTSGGLSATGTASAAVADAALAANTPMVVIKGVAVALLMTFTDAYSLRGTKHRTPSSSALDNMACVVVQNRRR